METVITAPPTPHPRVWGVYVACEGQAATVQNWKGFKPIEAKAFTLHVKSSL